MTVRVTTNTATLTQVDQSKTLTADYNVVRPWTPAQLTATAWYDADETSTITSASGLVSQWDDLSGNDNHLTQGTGAKQPVTGTRSINSLNALDFDGVDDFLSITTPIDIIGKHVFIALYLDDYDNNNIVLGGSGNVQVSLGDPSFNMRLWKASSPYSGDTKSTTRVSAGEAGVYGWLADTDTKKFSINGTLEDVGDAYVSGALVASKVMEGQFALGADGALGELIIAPTLTQANREKVEGYLAHKWGTTASLPAGHPYKASGPTI